MIIPSSFQAAYALERNIVEEVKGIAGSRLRVLCDAERWLFADRVKDEESTLARLQLGDIESLADVHDFYGATVIVPTRNQLERATVAVCELFGDAVVRKERNIDPKAFPYDDIHVAAQLGSSATRERDPSGARRFEVQIRTGLQYAWWWATHDVIYKGGVQDWRAHRVASQARASLELLDAVLANLEATAELQPTRQTENEEVFRALGKLTLEWSERERPRDVRRFCETALVFGEAGSLDGDALIAAVRDESNRDVVGIPGITPAQGVFIAVFRSAGEGMIECLRAGGRYVFVSAEMCAACPELERLTPEVCVKLG